MFCGKLFLKTFGVEIAHWICLQSPRSSLKDVFATWKYEKLFSYKIMSSIKICKKLSTRKHKECQGCQTSLHIRTEGKLPENCLNLYQRKKPLKLIETEAKSDFEPILTWVVIADKKQWVRQHSVKSFWFNLRPWILRTSRHVGEMTGKFCLKQSSFNVKVGWFGYSMNLDVIIHFERF